jgi:hypothetical protein
VQEDLNVRANAAGLLCNAALEQPVRASATAGLFGSWVYLFAREASTSCLEALQNKNQQGLLSRKACVCSVLKVRAVLRGADDGAAAVAVAVALLSHTETLVAEHGANLLTNLCGAPPYSSLP